MKIQLASDLHLDLLGPTRADWTVLRPAPRADLLVLAGNIDVASRALTKFKDWPVPVLYVPGNHEFYDHDWSTVRGELRRLSKDAQIHVLDNRRLDLDGIRFLGCTLWSDFTMGGLSQQEAMHQSRAELNDFHLIGNLTGTFMPEDALADHQHSRAWLQSELSTSFEGPTVVVTHHAPHLGSLHPKYANDPRRASFVSDLTHLLERATLWLHGHGQDSVDYQVAGCRVVANPAGGPLNRRHAHRETSVRFQNQAFQPALVFEVPH